MARPDPSDRSNWSVVIPVLQEAQQLPSLLAQLQGPEEVWVIDGGSRDGSGQIARLMGAHWLRSAPSRGAQLRLGAAQATRPWLLFLHADARLPSHWASVLAAELRDPAVAAALSPQGEWAWLEAALVGAAGGLALPVPWLALRRSRVGVGG